MGCENMIFENMNMRQVVFCHPLIEKTRAKHETFSTLVFVQDQMYLKHKETDTRNSPRGAGRPIGQAVWSKGGL